jgi:hypothetical protein
MTMSINVMNKNGVTTKQNFFGSDKNGCMGPRSLKKQLIHR